jgi:hypothetical protein
MVIDYQVVLHIFGIKYIATGFHRRRYNNAVCTPIDDTFGFAAAFGTVNGIISKHTNYYTNDAHREDGFVIDDSNICNTINLSDNGECDLGVVRCFRTL